MTAADLTPDLLTRMLAPSLDGAAVTDVALDVVGTGQMAECLRLSLSYDRETTAPATLVAKLPSDDDNSRAAATAVRAYEIEVNFYRHLQPGLGVRTPRCYYADLDVDAGDFVLLLEDVAPARQGDQLAGCGVDAAAAAVAELPGLHAPHWGDDGLASYDWLHRNTEESRGFLGQIVRMLHPGFVERYADRLPPDVLGLTEQVVERIDEVEANRPGPWTVTHGDFRLDNLLFGDDPADGVAVVDWQTSVHGPGVADLAYFLGGSLTPDDRRAHEVDLVRDYQQRMHAAGVALDWDDLWVAYRRYSVGGLIMALAASMMVKRTDRGDDMFMTMAERAGRHALDLDALATLSSPSP
jgi:aminoglycoside/choline kinase family phosphotransferase